MKFEEKLINLRKRENLSQEQLAEKLNVTRQTISKWELGESKPNMDKLIEISTLFGIDINELTNENKNVSNKEMPKNEKKRKTILSICVILLILSVGTLTYRLYSSAGDSIFNFDNFDIFDKFDDFDVSSFNSRFENHAGKTNGFFLESIISDLITSNKKNKNHQIEFILDGVSFGTDENKINDFKNNNDSASKEFDLSFEYGEDGYINKFIVKTIVIEKDISANIFNFQFENRAGNTSGFLLESNLSELITSNKKNKKHQVELIVNGTSLGTDETKIIDFKNKNNSISKQFDISFEYDENGYINKYIVKTLN